VCSFVSRLYFISDIGGQQLEVIFAITLRDIGANLKRGTVSELHDGASQDVSVLVCHRSSNRSDLLGKGACRQQNEESDCS